MSNPEPHPVSSPSKAVDDEMVERACRAFYGERWLRMDGQDSARRWMRDALLAALQANCGEAGGA